MASEDERPVVFMDKHSAERIQGVLTELRSGPTDAFDLTLLGHIAARLGISPRAALSRALTYYCNRVIDGKIRKPRKLKPKKPPALPAPKGWNDLGLLERKADE